MEFCKTDSNADKIKMYESGRQILYKIHAFFTSIPFFQLSLRQDFFSHRDDIFQYDLCIGQELERFQRWYVTTCTISFSILHSCEHLIAIKFKNKISKI